MSVMHNTILAANSNSNDNLTWPWVTLILGLALIGGLCAAIDNGTITRILTRRNKKQ